MSVNDNKERLEENGKYIELLKIIRGELPNIVLPSMGMLDETDKIEIDGKNYIISDYTKEE